MIVGFMLAILLTRPYIKGSSFYRVIYFAPVPIAPVISGIIWSWIYHPEWGLINTFLRTIGLGFLAQRWLGNIHTAMLAIITASVWSYYGYCMVVFIAGLYTYWLAFEVDEVGYGATAAIGLTIIVAAASFVFISIRERMD